MRRLALLTSLAGWFILSASAQETGTNAPALPHITATEAAQHLNTRVVVSGLIAEVNKAERLVRLNFDKPYPNQALTAIIFANHTNLFPEIEKLKGKTVEVTGKITEYRGRPEIVLTSTNQLTIVEKIAAPAEEKKQQ